MLLVTGVVLLAWGAAALVRATPGWWRLLAVPAAMALLWFVLLPLTLVVNATSRPPGPLGPPAPVSRSGGHAMDFGWWGDRDIAAAVSFLARPPGIQVAPVLAHVLSHATSLVHGAELPPHPHRAPAISTDKVKPQVR
jgi:hypothetical protein